MYPYSKKLQIKVFTDVRTPMHPTPFDDNDMAITKATAKLKRAEQKKEDCQKQQEVEKVEKVEKWWKTEEAEKKRDEAE